MALLFCHGLESGPIGRKSQALLDAGYTVRAPDCRGLDLGARVRAITAAIVAEPRPPVLVGSSFGGIAGLLAALAAADQGIVVPSLVLLAPALHLPLEGALDRPLTPPAPTSILHGTGDTIIPIDVSRRFAAEHGARLAEVDDDHRLGRSLERILELVAAAPGVDPPAA
jgi:pimeloyl-ACP methyl ester carboxylesterase